MASIKKSDDIELALLHKPRYDCGVYLGPNNTMTDESKMPKATERGMSMTVGDTNSVLMTNDGVYEATDIMAAIISIVALPNHSDTKAEAVSAPMAREVEVQIHDASLDDKEITEGPNVVPFALHKDGDIEMKMDGPITADRFGAHQKRDKKDGVRINTLLSEDEFAKGLLFEAQIGGFNSNGESEYAEKAEMIVCLELLFGAMLFGATLLSKAKG